jgi:hypothetical protein
MGCADSTIWFILKYTKKNSVKTSNISKQVINVKLINKPNMLPMLKIKSRKVIVGFCVIRVYFKSSK